MLSSIVDRAGTWDINKAKTLLENKMNSYADFEYTNSNDCVHKIVGTYSMLINGNDIRIIIVESYSEENQLSTSTSRGLRE